MIVCLFIYENHVDLQFIFHGQIAVLFKREEVELSCLLFGDKNREQIFFG